MPYYNNSVPDEIPSCKAMDYGGIPVANVLYKLEETDTGFDNHEDYITKIEYETDQYLRNAVTDRNIDLPFTEADLPGYNATRNSGALNLRYNENRGSTDYMPAHPEMMIGSDPYAGCDTGLKMAEMKKYTAQRAYDAEVRMGDNNAEALTEQPWADYDISYAKKDAMVWTSKVKNIWQWPQFYNINVSHKSETDPESKKQLDIDCAKDCIDEEINANAAYDDQGKVRKNQVGYTYDLGKYQAQTTDFHETQMNRQTKTKHPEMSNSVLNNITNELKYSDSEKAKTFKGKLIGAMKSAIESQEATQTMSNSVNGRKVKSGKERDINYKSVIEDIIQGHKKDKEVKATIRKGVHPSDDLGYTKRHSEASIRNTLQIKGNMIKGARNEGDQQHIQRNIEQSMKLNKEEKTKLCAGSLMNYVDRGAIMKEIAHQHKTGCSEQSKCRKDKLSGNYLEKSRKDETAITTGMKDDYHTHVRSTKKLEENPRSLKDYSHFTNDVLDTNLSDTCRYNTRNR